MSRPGGENFYIIGQMATDPATFKSKIVLLKF